jgi:HK97 family phage prohead protease
VKPTKPAPELEARITPGMVELRAGGPRRIGGYACVFGKLSRNLGGFVEQVDYRAWNKSAGDGWPSVVARHNHLDEMLLGTTRAGTLRLSVDRTGLAYEVDLPAHRADVFELVQRGDVANSSFAFECWSDSWSHEGGTPLRTLLSCRLVDVASVTTPAYEDSTVGLRSLARFVDAPFDDVVERARQDQLRSFFIRTDNRGTPQPQRSGLDPNVALAHLSRRQYLDTLARRWTPDDLASA